MRKITDEWGFAAFIPRPWTPEEIAESCEATADLLEDGHWTRGSWIRATDTTTGDYYDMTDATGVETEDFVVTYCIEGAMAAVLGLDLNSMAEGSSERDLLMECPVYDAVLTTINDDTYHGCDLMGWNDSEGREESEVVDVLRRTAKRVLGVGPDQMTVHP